MLVVVFWLSAFLVIYTYMGYPLLIALFVLLKPGRADVHVDILPTVTLLITAYNEEQVIARKLDNSLALDYPRDQIQIIVAADGSSDCTAEIVREYAGQGVELNYVPERSGKIVAMNRAMPKARGEIVVFSDANNMYEPDVLRQLVVPFSDPKVGAATGAKFIVQDGSDLSSAEGIYWKYESWIKKNETAFSSCVSAVGEILAIRRSLFNPPPGSIINDDYYIVLELIKRGFQVYYVPEARSFEYISASATDEIVRRTRMSTGKYQAMFSFYSLLPFHRPLLLWQIISHKYFRALLPFGFIGVFVANVLILLFPSNPSPRSFLYLTAPYGWVLLTLQLIFYGMALVGSRISFKGFLGKLFYIPTYLVNSNIAVLKGLYGYLTKNQTNIWERVRRENI